jgi:hypothetical protein
VERRTIRKLRGAVELVTDAVEAAATETQRVHEEFARRPYAVLERIGPIAAPVRAIERVHTAVMETAYGSVRILNALAGAVVTTAIDRLERDPVRPGAAPGPSPARR